MERFELRLSPECIEAIDKWRAEQADVPSRAEAARRLLEVGLGASNRQTYLMMKFLLLTTYMQLGEERISSATAFAWSRDIHPIYDEGGWAEPYGNQFQVTERMLEELQSFLHGAFESGKPASFYQLEDHFVRKAGQLWSRAKLVNACHYMHEEGQVLPEEVWKELLRGSDHPIEAKQIVSKVEERHVYV